MKTNQLHKSSQTLVRIAIVAAATVFTTAQAQTNYEPYVISTLAGTAGNFSSDDGCGPGASFASPQGVAVDGAGNVYIADTYYSLIRKITPNGCVTTLVGPAAHMYYPVAIALDPIGNIYVTDSGYGNIRVFDSAGVQINGYGGFPPGPTGESLHCITVDNAGYIYASASYSIVKISPTGTIETLAGSGVRGYADGIGSAAQFWHPEGIAVDGAGNVYVSEIGDYQGGGDVIRKITPDGVVSTFAGQFGVPGSTDGTVSTALFNQPAALAMDGVGNIYVGDVSAVRKITPGGSISTLAGGIQGYADGTGAAARFNGMQGLAVDSTRKIYVADSGNGVIRVGVPAVAAQVQQPINPDGSSVFSVRRGVIPVKFTLTQGGVATCDLPPAPIALTRTAGGTIGAIDENVYSGSADNGTNFRIDSCQYVYNLSSGALGPGMYRVDILIGGSVVGSGTFGLK